MTQRNRLLNGLVRVGPLLVWVAAELLVVWRASIRERAMTNRLDAMSNTLKDVAAEAKQIRHDIDTRYASRVLREATEAHLLAAGRNRMRVVRDD